ncbi:hypothetical protein ACFQ4G_05355 [Methylobacterium marchantiae]|uniref:Tyrosine specific protein phosphatases domain-containing protein n=1 Tax=Methylobacterium marchantiae TaxID=600331 RepID=A0ABW3WW01_9HYPH
MFLDFVARSHGNLLIYCHDGLSRSPALAIVALAARGRDPVEACALVRAAVPEASPNRLVLALAGRTLGVDLVAAASGFTFRRGPVGALGRETGLRRVLK